MKNRILAKLITSIEAKTPPHYSVKHILLFFTFALLVFIKIHAQTPAIHGVIQDAVSQKKINFATVSVYLAKDTTLVTYRLSDLDGKFRIPNLSPNTTYRLLITYMGYAVYRKTFELRSDTSRLDIGIIRLAPDAHELSEVIVTAERPPVLYKKDTIEFNASSFKTLPTAIVEDLLKKLPGVQVDVNGNITVNGRSVNRILVDGKSFFGGDARMATRNLPANIIDKVQVIDDKDQVALNPDAPLNAIGQIINLSIKKVVKKGWFGKGAVGTGTEKRYETSAILNHFRDTLQISILGFANNINKAAFGYEDLQSLGGFRRSGSTGSIPLYSLSFGGNNNGIQQTSGMGLNVNNELKQGITLNTQYFYGATSNDITEATQSKQQLGDTIQQAINLRNSNQKAFSHKLGLGIRWRPNPRNRLEFKPTLLLIDQKSTDLLEISNTNNKNGILNSSKNNGLKKAAEFSYNHSLIFFKTYTKVGRSFNISNNINIVNITNDQTNKVLDSFYNQSPAIAQTLNQLRNRNQQSFAGSLSVNYAEPLSKQTTLRLGHVLNYDHGTDSLLTFTLNPITGNPDFINTALSNTLKRSMFRNNTSIGINWRNTGWTITSSINYLRFDIENKFSTVNKILNQQFNYLLPSLSAGWKAFNLNYSESILPPAIIDLQAAPDNSNPLNIFIGNPNLKPTRSSNLSFNFFKYYPGERLSANIYITGSFRKNDIARSRFFDPQTGIQTATTINVDGTHDLTVFGSLNKQFIFNNKTQFSVGGTASFINGKRLVVVNGRNSEVSSMEFFPTLQTRLNWNSTIELMASGSLSRNKYKYQHDIFPQQATTIFRSYNELVIRWPKNIVIESTLTYRQNATASAGAQKSYTLLNSAATLLFLKDNKGQLKLSIFDILRKNTVLSNYVLENYFIDYQSNTLGQFLMLSFYYDFRGVKASSVGGRQRLLLF